MKWSVLLGSGILSAMVLAGCGVSGRTSAQPSGNGTLHPALSSASPSSHVPTASSIHSPSLSSSSPNNETTSSTSAQQVARILVSAHPNSVEVNQNTVINGKVYLANGQGASHARISILGLPHDASGKTFNTNKFGEFSFDAQWAKPGTYTVSVGNGLVAWQTQVRVNSGAPASSASPSAANNLSSSIGPTALQALQYLSSHTTLILGAPTVVPHLPSPSGYLAAQAQASSTGWVVHLLETTRAYAVNNPQIPQHLIDAPQTYAAAIASFGVTHLTGTIPSSGNPQLPSFLWQEGLIASGMGPNALGPLTLTGDQSRTVNLGYGITGTLYQQNSFYSNLVWQEGEWTFVVMNTNKRQAVSIAQPVVTYLHTAYLPPHPGLVAINIGAHGAYTHLDWIANRMLYHINNDTLAVQNNAVEACQMAVSWHSYSGAN